MFDALLAGPWPQPAENRPSVPAAIIAHLRAEALNQCVRCASGVGVDTAHIDPWARSRSHHHANLLRICSACHREHDIHHSIPTAELRALKSAAVERVRASLLARMRPALAVGTPLPGSAHFFGRRKEQDQLVDALRSLRSILITGVGGIGKTELLLQALRRSETGRAVMWIDVEQYKNAADIQAALLAAAGSEGTACSLVELPARLDSMAACLVFDGIEQAGLTDLDDLEAMIAKIQAGTTNTQVVLTSQAMLYGIERDWRIEIRGLDEDASRSILDLAEPEAARESDVTDLLLFCEGHALTLRIAAALTEHHGGAAAAMRAIASPGTDRMKFPGRKKQDRKSSLDLCLDSAYAALTPSSRRLLWLLAEAPAGLAILQLEQDWHGISEPMDALADLRRWHLIGTAEIRENFTRTHMLSPVRAFAIARARAEDPAARADLIGAFILEHATVIAALGHIYRAPDDTPQLLYRLREELPNFLHCLALARAQPDSGKNAERAVEIAAALMRYFFVSGLCEQGAKLMHDAAKLATETGQIRRAITIIPQMLTLARRAGDDKLIHDGIDLAATIERSAEGRPGLLGDIAISRAIAERDHSDTAEFEWQTRLAYEHYCVQLRTAMRKARVVAGHRSADSSILDDLDDFHNSIANALAMLGDAWLEARMFERAAKAYRYALRHGRGDWIAVNQGQTLHQIGNCHSHLKDFSQAAVHYREAARIFHFVGMEQYLSNALGELGLLLLDFPAESALDTLTPALVEAGLSDLERDLQRVFDPATSLDHKRCHAKLRKLAGGVILASLLGHHDSLGEFCVRAGHGILDPMGASWLAGGRNPDEGLPLGIAQSLVMGGLHAANGEREFILYGQVSTECLDAMIENGCKPGRWVRDEWRLLEWLSVLLTRRWGYGGAGFDRLRRYADNFDQDIEDPIELRLDLPQP